MEGGVGKCKEKSVFHPELAAAYFQSNPDETYTWATNKGRQLSLDDARMGTPFRSPANELLKRVRRLVADGNSQAFESLTRLSKVLVITFERVRREIGSAQIVKLGGTLEDERMRRRSDDGERRRDARNRLGRRCEQAKRMDKLDEEILERKNRSLCKVNDE